MSTAESPLDRLERPSVRGSLWILPWLLAAAAEAVLTFSVAASPFSSLLGLLFLQIVLVPLSAVWTQVRVTRSWDRLLQKLPWEQLCLTGIKPDEFIDWILHPIRREVRLATNLLSCSTLYCVFLATASGTSIDAILCNLATLGLFLVYRHVLLRCSSGVAAVLAFRSVLYSLDPTASLLRSVREYLLMLGGFLLILCGMSACFALAGGLLGNLDVTGGGSDWGYFLSMFGLVALIALALWGFVCPILLPAYMSIRAERIRKHLPGVAPLWRGAEGREQGYPAEGLLSFPRYLIGRMDPPPTPPTSG